MAVEVKELSLELKERKDEMSARSESGLNSTVSKLSEKSSRKPSRLSPLKKEPTAEKENSQNPFKIRGNEDLFAFRDREKKMKQEERIRQQSLKVHEKTYGTNDRMKFRQVELLRDPEEDELDKGKDQALAVKEDPEFVIAVTKNRHVDKETLSEYISKKREMFLVQYSLSVKKDEMRKLEEISVEEEKKLELAEQYLEDDAAMFDEFLKENDKSAVDATKIAEAESKERIALVSEVKSLTTQLMQIKSEINKYEEQLKEYKMYKEFLNRLVPENVQQEKLAAKAARRESSRKIEKKDEDIAQKPRLSIDSGSQGSRRPSVVKKASEQVPRVQVIAEDPIEEQSSDESDMELYFKSPQELLSIFTELEESNLSLIQTCQETEESLDELKQIKSATELKMKNDTDLLMQQISKLEKSIEIEEDKISELKLKKELFELSDSKTENQDEFLKNIQVKVQEVFKTCVTDTEAEMTTLEMLTAIENQLEILFEAIDQMPPEKVEIAQKAKDKERRLQLREEKKELQRQHQEDNKRKALERAQAAPKKQTGRRIIARSEPPQIEKDDSALNDQKNREEEELMYFFT